MKGITLLVTALLASGIVAQAQTSPQQAWDNIYPQIEQSIKAPEFRDHDYTPLAKVKKPKKGVTTLYTELINSAIEQCSNEGGGRVIIPAGTWLTGPITLRSNVNLHLEEGATLLFTDDLTQYPLVRTRWEGMDCYNYQPMIYAYQQQNIAITGKGTIDGGGDTEHWWPMCGSNKKGMVVPEISQRIGRPLLQEWNENGVPLEQRQMGDGYGMRVQLVNPTECKNVLIEDVTLLRSPFWVIHPLLCENVTVRGVHIQNDGPNGDGCDPESCKNVLIEGCYFDTGDDCIAIKSGRNRDGREAGIPTENVIVRNCYMKNGHGGIVVGSEISGGFKNLFCHDCVMDSPELDRVVRIKTNACRGGVIEDIYVRNIEVGQCREAVMRINLVYEPKEPCDRSYAPTVRNVFLDNITCKESTYGVRLDGFQEICNIHNIYIENCHFDGVKDGNKLTGLYKNVVCKNLYINGSLCENLSEIVSKKEAKKLESDL